MHSHVLSLLEPVLAGKPSPRVLDVGSGSGILLAYLSALMHAQPGGAGGSGGGGRVFGIEHIPELVAAANAALAKKPSTKQLLDAGVIVNQVRQGGLLCGGGNGVTSRRTAPPRRRSRPPSCALPRSLRAAGGRRLRGLAAARAV
jgi:SAM-dependent methyltransferase